ncbi:MAG TPA: hypothetical protein VGN42_18565 [Pirellulales bacterium]|nr:hypothetical protein [Pirellulales bacterium]
MLKDEPWVVKLGEDRPSGTAIGGAGRNASADERLTKRFAYAAVVRGFAPLLIAKDNSLPGKSRPLNEYGLRQLARYSNSTEAAARLFKFAVAAVERGASVQVAGEPTGPSWLQSRFVVDYDDRIQPTPRKHVEPQMDFVTTLQEIQETRTRIFTDLFELAPEVARPPLQEYAFLAGSVEDAKRLAKDFLDVYDLGFLPMVEKRARSEKANYIKGRDERAPRLAEMEQQDAAAERELEGVEELDQGAVSDLKVKRALLKVELAGVEARLTAIEAKLKKMDSRDTTGPRLLELKVAADIDLASLAAQRKVLDQLIDGQHRLAELAQFRQNKLRPLQTRAEHAARNIQRCDEILADLIPFQLVDDSVVIRPVKFEVAAEEE